MPFLSPKWPTCPEQIFFWHKPLLLLSSTYWPFSLCKILKNSYSGSQVMRIHHFWDQNSPFAPNIFFFFFLRIINIILIYLLAPFIVQNLKKNTSTGSRDMRTCNFWAQNGPFQQMRIFSENLLSLVSFIHAYLNVKNQSQILIYW